MLNKRNHDRSGTLDTVHNVVTSIHVSSEQEHIVEVKKEDICIMILNFLCCR